MLWQLSVDLFEELQADFMTLSLRNADVVCYLSHHYNVVLEFEKEYHSVLLVTSYLGGHDTQVISLGHTADADHHHRVKKVVYV